MKVKDSIAAQLLKRVFAVYLLIAVSVTLVHMTQEYRHAKKLITEELKDLELTFAPGLAASIWYLDYSIVDSITDGIIKIPTVVGIKIIDQDGKEISSLGSIIDQDNQVISVSRKGVREKLSQSALSGVFGHKFKLIRKNSYLGEVYFYSSYNIIFKRVKVGFFFLILNSIIKTLALWVIFLWFGRKYLSFPLALLTERLKHIDLDHLNNKSIKIQLKGENELKLLETSFNMMLGKLKLARERFLSFQDIYQQVLSGDRRELDFELIFKKLSNNIQLTKAVLMAEDENGVYFVIGHVKSNHSFLEKNFRRDHLNCLFGQTGKKFIIFNNVSPETVVQPLLFEIGTFQSGSHVAFILLPSGPLCVLYKSPEDDPFDSSDEIYIENLIREVEIIENNHQILAEKERVEKEKQELQEQLYQSQKMEAIGTLAGGIAHDFNNILMPIIGYTEMSLENNIEDNEALRHNLEIILQSGLRAKELVQQILAFSRQEKQELKPLRLQPIIKEALRLFSSSIPGNIELIKNINLECGPVLANPVQIHQIIMNLLNNAIFAMKEQAGNLTIELEEVDLAAPLPVPLTGLKEGNYLLLRIQDTGCGIPAEILDKIFEPYFTTKKLGEGTGLGLAVVHGIIKDYQGKITVDSRIGEGTAFSIYLPRVNEIFAQDYGLSVPKTPGGVEQILVVDDEKNVGMALKNILESLGYQAHLITNALDAVDYVEKNSDRIDLLIVDWAMPKMSGLELAKKARTIKINLPVIVCSGYGNQIPEEEYQRSGVSAYVMKPVLKQVLGQKVREVLDKNQVILGG